MRVIFSYYGAVFSSSLQWFKKNLPCIESLGDVHNYATELSELLESHVNSPRQLAVQSGIIVEQILHDLFDKKINEPRHKLNTEQVF